MITGSGHNDFDQQPLFNAGSRQRRSLSSAGIFLVSTIKVFFFYSTEFTKKNESTFEEWKTSFK